MLRDYTKYLESIRDSLIQCGVTFPKIEDLNAEEYERVFYAGEELNTIMYFYNIMVCSGNMEEIFLPSNSSYKNYMRTEAFKEFSEDILPMLKEQCGDCSDIPTDLECLDVEDVEEPEEWVNNDVPVEDIIIGIEELFGEDEEPLDGSEIDMAFSEVGGNSWEMPESIEEEPTADLEEDELGDEPASEEPVLEEVSVNAGRNMFAAFMDMHAKSESPETVVGEFELDTGKDMQLSNQGTDLFSIKVETKQQDRPVEDIEWSAKGTELFSIKVDSKEQEDMFDWVEDTEEDSLIDEDQDSWVEDTDEEDDDQDSWVDDKDDIQDSWVDEPEEESISWADEDFQDSWVEESDDELDNSVDSQDSWVADEEEDEESLEWSEEEESSSNSTVQTSENVVKQRNMSNNMSHQIKSIDQERDIVDSIQEAASTVLTSAKQFITRLAKTEE